MAAAFPSTRNVRDHTLGQPMGDPETDLEAAAQHKKPVMGGMTTGDGVATNGLGTQARPALDHRSLLKTGSKTTRPLDQGVQLSIN